MSGQINPDRRRPLGTAAMTIAAIALASIALNKSWFLFTRAPMETPAEDKGGCTR
jgi:hypothetical protein